MHLSLIVDDCEYRVAGSEYCCVGALFNIFMVLISLSMLLSVGLLEAHAGETRGHTNFNPRSFSLD